MASKYLNTSILAMAGLIAAANVAHAATTEELEQRLDRMEQMMQKTRAELAEQKRATARARHEAEAARRASHTQQNASQAGAANKKPSNNQAKKQPGAFHIGKHTTAKIGGYIKADTIYNHTSDGELGNRASDFYINGAVPVGNESSADDVDFTARQTRVHLTTLTKLGGHKIKGYVETDFYGDTGAGAAKLVNGYRPRLRHAYIKVDDSWLFGQTWTNFMDLSAYPETLDFVGPNEGQIFIRQAQIRYTHNNFSAAIENPDTTFSLLQDDDNLPVGAATSDDHYPELTLSYSQPTSFGHLSGGFLAKDVSAASVDNPASGQPYGNSKAFGYGLRFSGSVDLTSSDGVKFQGFYGDGIGRYVALGTVPAGYIKQNGDVKTISAYGGYLDYRHDWSAHWRSNLVLGALEADNPSAFRDSPNATKRVDSVHANLLWNPVDPLTLGGEYLFARRAVENNDAHGNLSRVQFSAKYEF